MHHTNHAAFSNITELTGQSNLWDTDGPQTVSFHPAHLYILSIAYLIFGFFI